MLALLSSSGKVEFFFPFFLFSNKKNTSTCLRTRNFIGFNKNLWISRRRHRPFLGVPVPRATQCMRGAQIPQLQFLVFYHTDTHTQDLSLTLTLSLIINNTYFDFSRVDLLFVVRYFQFVLSYNPVYVSHVSSTLALSLSSHRLIHKF